MPLLRSTLPALVLLLVAGCAGPAQTVPVEPSTAQPTAPALDRPLPYPLDVSPAFEQAVARGTRTRTGVPGEDYFIQEAAYDMTARLFPEDRRLEGTARIAYHNNAPHALDELYLELAQNLHQEGVARHVPSEVTGGVELRRVAAAGTELSTDTPDGPRYDVEGTLMRVELPEPLPPGGTVELAIDWAFTVPKRGASGRMGYDADNLFFIAYWYPIVAVYDDVYGWVTDPFLGQAEFYADFADYDVTIEAPAGWIVWATGELQNADDVLAPSVVERMRRAHASLEPMVVAGPDLFGNATASGDEGRLQWHFTANDVRDFAFSATRESIWMAAHTPVGDLDGDGTEDYTAINTFYRELAPLWEEVTRYQQHAITFLSEYTGLPYPWPHMTAVEGSGIIGGGMEFPMMTLMGDYNMAGDTALYNVTAHELAHMWVPMMVNTNERRFSWLDEGTTTFNENQARRDFFPGTDPGRADQEVYLAVAEQHLEGEIMRRSDFHYPGPAFGIASYMKPATALRALRGVLGEETFHRALQDFFDTWAFKHPYPYDFFNTFERVSGRDLDWFWRTWYYETWTLDQAVANVTTRDGRTTIVVEDQGRAPMPVDLAITLAGGETLRREIPVDVWLSGTRRTTLTLDTESPVTRVEIDPERDFPDIDRDDNVWTP